MGVEKKGAGREGTRWTGATRRAEKYEKVVTKRGNYGLYIVFFFFLDGCLAENVGLFLSRCVL